MFPISAQIPKFIKTSASVFSFECFQLLFTNLVSKFVCIPKDPITTSKEMPAKKWPWITKINKRKKLCSL